MGQNRRKLDCGGCVALAVVSLLALLTASFLVGVGGPGEHTGAILERLEREGKLAEPAAASPEPVQTATPVPMPTQTPEIQTAEPDVGFTLAVAGSVSVPRPVREAALEGNGYDFSTVFLGLGTRFSQADLSICTLETLTDDRAPLGKANAPATLLDSLRAAGVDLVSLGTEHAYDAQGSGLDVTVSELTTRGMMSVGLREADSLPGQILQIGGMKLAVLGYTYGVDAQGSSTLTPALMDEAQIGRDILRARSMGADVVVLLMHWGVINRRDVPESLRRLARRLGEAGADLILGSHTNFVLPVETMRVRRADGMDYPCTVAYALGFLLSDARSVEGASSAILRFAIAKEDGRVCIDPLPVIPTYLARQQEGDRASVRLIEADNEASRAVLIDSEREAAILAAQYVRQTVGEEEEL